MIETQSTSDDDVRAIQYLKKNELDVDQQYIDEQTLLSPHSDIEEITEKLITIDDDDDNCLECIYCVLL